MIYNTPEWKRLRKQILLRDNYTCVNCGCHVHGKGRSRVDHIIPLKKRPDLAFEPSNLRTLCPKCDNLRHYGKFPNQKEKVEVMPDGSPKGESWT
jgi:5-methylcytosine-specific restriction endonuclease McrA